MIEDTSLVIPLNVSGDSANDKVEIFTSELSEISADDIIQTLQMEKASPTQYFDFALAYSRMNDLESYRDVLEAGMDVDAPECPKSDVSGTASRESKMRIYCALATIKVQEAAVLSKTGQGDDADITKLKVEELYGEANDLFDLSDRINQFWPVTWCCKGVMLLQRYEFDGTTESKKTLERANYYFNAAMKEGKSLPCYLGLGAVNFLDGKYEKAITNFSSAISNFPKSSGPGARVALGLSCYKLGYIDRAKACFDRAIYMDEGNTEGIVGRAVLDLASADDTEEEGKNKVENAIKMIVTAPLNDSNNAMVKNKLANHFFYVYSAIPGTVTVDTDGDGTSLTCSQSMDIKTNDRIRIGLDFETTVLSSSSSSITISSPFRSSSSSSNSALTVYNHDFDRVLNFAKAGFHATKVNAIKAESCWLMGRVHQVQGEFENAEKFFHQSVKLDSSFSPALFSYAQILVRKKDYLAAVQCLEKVLKTLPNSPDTLSLLGFILAKDVNKRQKALNYLQRAIELNPRDSSIHLMYATVLRGNVVDFAKSLDAYGKSMSFEVPEEVSPTTYNNVGVLNAWKSSFEEAEAKYVSAIEHLTGIKLPGPEDLETIGRILESGKEHSVTVVFNLARLYEEKKEFEKAANIQKTIVKKLPAYTGSYVRLATIARDMGAMKQCSEWLKQALEVSTDNSELLSMIGHFWIEDGEYEMGQKIYERLLNEGQTFMLPYAQVSLGNIYFSNVSSGGERAKKLIDYATLFYKKALKADPSNVFAASGLGCVLAEKGKVEEAKNVFQRVRECSNDAIVSTYLNLGHVLLALGQHAPSIAMYKKYLEQTKAQGTETEIFGYLAIAYYSWAKYSEESTDPSEGSKLGARYEEGLMYLEKSKAFSTALDTLYNIALLKKDYSMGILSLREKKLKRTLADVKKAKEMLQEAEEVFEELGAMEKDKHIHFSTTKCNFFVEHIKTILTDPSNGIESQIEYEKQLTEYEKDKKETQNANAENQRIEKEKKRLAKEEELAEKERMREALAKANQEKAEQLADDLKYGMGGTGGKSKKKNNDFADDDDDDDDGVVAGAEVGGGGDSDDRAALAPSNNDLFGGESSDDDDVFGGAAAAPVPMEVDKAETAGQEEGGITAVNKLFEDSDSDEEDKDGGNEKKGEGTEGEPSSKRRKVVEDDE